MIQPDELNISDAHLYTEFILWLGMFIIIIFVCQIFICYVNYTQEYNHISFQESVKISIIIMSMLYIIYCL